MNTTTAARQAILASQRRWMEAKGEVVDALGYVVHFERNLFKPLSAAAYEAFKNADGGELIDTLQRPAKMRALHSSSALAANVFDGWEAPGDRAALATALSLEVGIKRIKLEEKFSTGLRGNPPNLDVVIELLDGGVLAIESKFTEWLARKPARAVPEFAAKYFAQPWWELKRLRACQSLADDIAAGRECFELLDALQLLKHALGLATQRPGRFSLGYLYFDAAGEPASLHAAELGRFAERVGSELRLRTSTYQTLIARLASSEHEAARVAYLRSRYLATIQAQRADARVGSQPSGH